MFEEFAGRAGDITIHPGTTQRAIHLVNSTHHVERVDAVYNQ